MTDEINWAAHDPTTLAGNLRWTKLFLFTGNGMPGPLDPTLGIGTAGASSIEAGVHLMTTLFHQRLREARDPERHRRLRTRHPFMAVLGPRPT